MIFDLNVLSTYLPTQTLSVSPRYFTVGNTLTWSQLVAKNIRTRRTSNILNLTQSVIVDRSITNLSVGNTLLLSHRAGKAPIYLDVISGYVIWDRAWSNIYREVVSHLDLVQTLDGGGSKGTGHALALTQSVGVSVIRALNVTSVLSLASNCSLSIPTKGAEFIVGVGPTVTIQDKVTFTFGSFTFQVRKPDFGSSDKLEFSRINRRSRGGDLIIYRDPQWPESITLMLPFSFLGNKDIINFRKLFELSLGEQVTYQDHLGSTWTGIILNPAEPIVQYGIDRFSLKVELQGART